MPHPSVRGVARRLRQAGLPVSYQTVHRWKRNRWRPIERTEHPIESARRRLDDATPLLTGDPRTTAEGLAKASVDRAAEIEKFPDGELLRRAARALAADVTAVSEAFMRQPEIIIQRPAELCRPISSAHGMCSGRVGRLRTSRKPEDRRGRHRSRFIAGAGFPPRRLHPAPSACGSNDGSFHAPNDRSLDPLTTLYLRRDASNARKKVYVTRRVNNLLTRITMRWQVCTDRIPKLITAFDSTTESCQLPTTLEGLKSFAPPDGAVKRSPSMLTRSPKFKESKPVLPAARVAGLAGRCVAPPPMEL